jgi:hypothetical protein
MLKATTIYLLNRWANAQSSQPINALVEEWLQRVATNGGEAPSQDTIDAVSRFADGLTANSALYAKMLAVNCMVPDNLEACCTPLVCKAGNTYWTPSAWFVANPGQLTTSGLKGGSSGNQAKLDTGVVPSLHMTGFADGGVTLYTTDAGGIFETHDVGAWTNLGKYFSLTTCFGNTPGKYDIVFDCWDTGAGRTLIDRTSAFTGYVSGNRIATNDSKVYIANSTLAPEHQTAGSDVTPAITKKPDHIIPLFAIWDAWSGIPQYTGFTDRRIAFCALHDGLTETESQQFYVLVQQLRTDLGGAI